MFKKISKMMMALAVAATVVTTVAAPATVEAATKINRHGIYIASFDSDKTNHVVSVKFNKKGNLVVKANFKVYDENARGFLVGKSTGTKTFTFTEKDYGEGIDGGTDYYLHNYKTGKTNPKFYHYTEDEFIEKCNAKMDSSWKLVVTLNGGKMVSAAIVKYNGSYNDSSRQGWSDSCTTKEDSWAKNWRCFECREHIGYGTEAERVCDQGCDAHEGKFFK